MSLLNDALRAAEQRQNRPEVTGAYTGQHQQQPAQRRWLVPLMILLLVLAVAVAVYGLYFRAGAQPGVPLTEEPQAPIESRTVVADEARQTEVSSPVPNSESEPKPEPQPEPKQILVEAPTQSAPELAETPEQTPAPREPDEPVVTRTATQTRSQPVSPSPKAEPVRPKEETAEPVVKTVRETPEAIDRRVSRDLARLLRAGESRAAEQKLADLVATQAAPLSREVYARAMLVQDAPERALPWVSGADAESHPALRLLRARALLPLGRLNEAVATLNQNVPPVAEHIEYRITLATLEQQAGQSVEAARHWSALIAVDDSRPAWWVGLAIALEAQGEASGAVKAYAQAAKLPGLSPSLADYVRNRLTLLQAG